MKSGLLKECIWGNVGKIAVVLLVVNTIWKNGNLLLLSSRFGSQTEEQFYIIWPLLLWLAWKKRFNLLVVSFVLALVSFGLNLYFYRAYPVADFFSPQTRFWELLAGAMLAWVALHPAQLSFRPGLFYRETTIGETPALYTHF